MATLLRSVAPLSSRGIFTAWKKYREKGARVFEEMTINTSTF